MRSQAPRGAGFLLRGCPGRPGLASLPGGAGFHWLEYDAGACSFFITGDPGVRCARPPGRPPPNAWMERKLLAPGPCGDGSRVTGHSRYLRLRVRQAPLQKPSAELDIPEPCSAGSTEEGLPPYYPTAGEADVKPLGARGGEAPPGPCATSS